MRHRNISFPLTLKTLNIDITDSIWIIHKLRDTKIEKLGDLINCSDNDLILYNQLKHLKLLKLMNSQNYKVFKYEVIC